MNTENILISIEKASQVIGKTWPLYSFVTSNPLSGYEQLPFEDAVKSAKQALSSNVYPETSIYRKAWENGEIEEAEVLKFLQQSGFNKSAEFYLKQMDGQNSSQSLNESHDLDRIMAKWLAAFMDEGLADWQLPGKKHGFYQAWRRLAIYDGELKKIGVTEIPNTSIQALKSSLMDFSIEDYESIFKYQLASLPGWVGYINYRRESNSEWQKEAPISLKDYLAVRLFIAKHLDTPIKPISTDGLDEKEIQKLQYIWLQAWESSWQNQLVKTLEKESINTSSSGEGKIPDAQMVFCIDTRSELIRRHVESKGNYETFGYAGFFGIAMDYTSLSDGISRKSCPPIVGSAYSVSEKPQVNREEKHVAFKRKNENQKFTQFLLKRMKNMLPSAFGYVEGSGFYYALSLLARTIAPAKLYDIKRKTSSSHESFCEPEINKAHPNEDQLDSISLNEKVAIVKSAFDLMGWKNFAPLVLFVGHGSHSANNPFGSSLDCGACAASPGRHNARMLAKLANQKEVRSSLDKDFDLSIPESTVFIGAEHNTTTDEIVIFGSQVPQTHQQHLLQLKSDLQRAQETATEDRLGMGFNSVAKAKQKANNWGETRPEWGLAKNAGFIIAPRDLSKNHNLNSRCFLHSYDWEKDITGQSLEGIMQGPMVVTQWINNHYYFSTVDNNKFGGGSKITHNITGKFGVVQGNGGDLKMGLPLQSLNQSDSEMYHQPLRLSVLIKAPKARLVDILERNTNLKTLLDNLWIYLMVMDPLDNNKIKRYQGNMKWVATNGSEVNAEIKKSKKVLESFEDAMSV